LKIDLNEIKNMYEIYKKEFEIESEIENLSEIYQDIFEIKN